ncbi:MAG TPA: hypothetical protein VEX43_12920 [Chthoniobacterales bacterium]|nr:hypothetical protein [Chthoniobacterales bacterium]
MKQKTYSIFGAGAAGLYTAWRLLDGKAKAAKDEAKQLAKGDVLELYDWGRYDFSKAHAGSREPGARVCTWHYKNDKTKSYVELGGMRYSAWDTKPSKLFPNPNDGKAPGHRLVTTVISRLDLEKYSVPFNESTNPLFYLRTKNLYLADISSSNPAPYNVDHFGAAASPDQGFAIVENLAVTGTTGPQTRAEWNAFYRNGRITLELPETSVFQQGDFLKDIGYWNLMYDQLGSDGYSYCSDGNGYTSNVINWNSAVAFDTNNEFTPGNQYNTLTTGYSGMFNALFDAIEKLAQKKGVIFKYVPNTRLHSVLEKNGVIHYTYATRAKPWKKAGSKTADAAWLAMPRHALELVAQSTRFEQAGLDVLNHQKVRLYLESAVMQPSYKVGMFFDSPWWTAQGNPVPTYPAQLTGYVVTKSVILALEKSGFPKKYLKTFPEIAGIPYTSGVDIINSVQELTQERLTVKQEEQLLTAAQRNTIGPSVTDTPIRQVVYFGNNARDQSGEPVYGMLASYDDEQFTSFWQGLELGPGEERHIPISEDTQPLKGPRKVPPRMIKMLRRQLAELHFGPNSDYSNVPEPKEAAYMDWSLPPFNAGYHAWAAHYDIADVQQKIRKPSQLIEGADANIFIVGEAYSNDQAWVEGAYCTAESVLNDFFGITPIIDNKEYPFICSSR